MLNRLMKYGAVATKTRVLYGQRLKHEDLLRIAAMRNIAEITAYLKTHPAWSTALSGVNPQSANRGMLEAAFQRHIIEEYLRLYKYFDEHDNVIMSFPLVKAEIEQVMLFMRYSGVGKAPVYAGQMVPLLEKTSKISFSKLSAAGNYAELLEAMRETDYYTAMLRVEAPQGGLPDYSLVETAMRGAYYKKVFETIKKSYGGEVKNLLNAGIGMQVDLINLISLLRVKHSFPTMIEHIQRYQLPVSYRLTPVFLRSLYAAQDAEAEMAVIRGSVYGRLFSEHSYNNLEDYYYAALYRYYNRHIADGVPSVCTVLAYLTLKEIEMRTLTNVVECARYGVDINDAPLAMIGF